VHTATHVIVIVHHRTVVASAKEGDYVFSWG